MGNKYKNALQAVKPKKTVQEQPENKNQRGGKRSNPDYRGTTFFLRKDTLLDANRLVLGSNMDLSDLLESLLQEWVAKQKAGKL